MLLYILGYCARFSLADQKIVNDPGLDCTKFEPSCPTRFPSNDSYKCMYTLTLAVLVLTYL